MKQLFVLLGVVILATLSLSAQTAERKVTLNWEDTQTDVTYNAYRASGDCSGTPDFVKLNTDPITAKTYEDLGVAEGTYCYVVRAERDTLESANSNTASVAVPAPPVVPNAPANLSVTVTVQVTVNP